MFKTTRVHVGVLKRLQLVIVNPVTGLCLSLVITANILNFVQSDLPGYVPEIWPLNLLMSLVALENLRSSLIAYRKTWRTLERRHARGKATVAQFRTWLWVKKLKMPCFILGGLMALHDFKKTLEVQNENVETGTG